MTSSSSSQSGRNRDGYFYSDIGEAQSLFSGRNLFDPTLAPTRIVFHLFLFLLTFITTTISGALFPLLLQDTDLVSMLFSLATDRAPITNGLLFSFTLLTILGTHELGHYIACRYYGVTATLPYFIPVPPPFGIGTLGAFIRIKAPIETRKALFDIGIAGPLAGFVFALPAALVGIYYSKPLTDSMPVTFNSPLLFVLLSKLLDRPSAMEWNPVWFACWVGMLATALNLLPVGQLDGGHVVYALFGRRGHKFVAMTITLIQAVIGYLGYTLYHWSGGFIYAAMLLLMFLLKHPPVMDEHAPIGLGRKILGFIAFIVFILSFMPIPIKID